MHNGEKCIGTNLIIGNNIIYVIESDNYVRDNNSSYKLHSSTHIISSDDEAPATVASDDITVIPETQMEVDDFQCVISHRKKSRLKLKIPRQQMEEITKDLGANDTESDTSG